MIITVRCPPEDRGKTGIRGCGALFEVDTDKCDDMVDCACGIWFNPSDPDNLPQHEQTVYEWAKHIAEYDGVTR